MGMTATEALERRIDELCEENERLRQENQSIGMAAYELGRASLAAENAKLRGFWTHDGTWHVELPRLPEGIAVTTPDERDREVHTARAWRYEPARTAKRVIVSNADTDHATGHCECGACGGAIDPWDAWCRHCGANLEEDA
jgi:hypothetical protein